VVCHARYALRRTPRGAQGLTIVEVLVAITVLCVGVLGTIAMLDGASAKTALTSDREAATALDRHVLEASRIVPYHQLHQGSLPTALQEMEGLADQSSASGWNVRRRKVTFTIAVTVCTVDDPADGAGTHSGSEFCSDYPAGSADPNPDDYKRVVVEVTWPDRGIQRRTKQATLVVNPGRGSGPAVQDLRMDFPLVTPVTSDVSSAAFTVTTSRVPAAVRWSVDGVSMGNASGSGTSWGFSWPIAGLADGIYLVDAEALDSQGAGGAIQSLTVALNRFLPAAPGGFAAGRNGAVVELEWLEGREGDLVGYRAYRLDSQGNAVAVCELTAEIACRDQSPPASDAVNYYAVAVDRASSGTYREGARSSVQTVTRDNHAPGAPTGLTATAATDGGTTLGWRQPVPADPDAGDGVAFYRIYRDGAAYAYRYDRTGDAAQLTYTDTETNGTAHAYSVTAVDHQLAESAFAGPVTR
jgi:Tfp pilus assembly protein PilV